MKIIVNDTLRKVWKEDVMAILRCYFNICLEGLMKPRKPARVIAVLVKVRTFRIRIGKIYNFRYVHRMSCSDCVLVWVSHCL